MTGPGGHEFCRECGRVLWSDRSTTSGLCSACHPDGPNKGLNWDALDVSPFTGEAIP